MKKLLSLLAIGSIIITAGNDVTSCFLFPKKESVYDNVVNKISGDSSLTWKNKEVASEDGKVHLDKNSEEEQLPETWTIMLTDLFGLESNNVPTKNEFHFITDISSGDNILEEGKQEDVSITVSKFPNKPLNPTTSKTITRKITWIKDNPSEQNLVDETFNEIDNKTNIYALGSNLNSNATDSLTSDAIKNNVGLTDEQKAITKLSGSLAENNQTSINFNIKDEKNEKIIDKDVTWYKTNKFINDEIFTTLKINNYLYCGTLNGLFRINLIDNSKEAVDASITKKIFYLKIYKDNLYVATKNGLYKLDEANNKLVFISGYSGVIYSLTVDNGLYASAEGDLYKLDEANNKIIAVDPAVSSKTFYTYVFNNILYIAQDNGLYKLNSSGKIEIVTSIGYSIEYLQDYKNILYVGTANGLYTLQSDNKLKQVDDSITKDVYSIVVYNNNLYLGIEHLGLYKLNSSSKLEKLLENNDETGIDIIDNTLFIHDSPIYTSFDNTYGFIFYYSNN